MGTLTNPRGRLPARVYWQRRALVLGTVLALVFALGRLVTGGDDTPTDTATVAGAHPTASASASPSARVVGPVGTHTTARPAPSPTGTPVHLAEPTGPCADDEITATPVATTSYAGRAVALKVNLTGIRPACTFVVSARSLALRITSGTDRIWTSQQCPASIRTASVVVRSAAPTTVTVLWHGRRSDETCSRTTSWALPGYYHATAAVIGSEPGDAQFRLVSPPRPVVTRTARPKVRTTAKTTRRPTATVTGKGTACGGDIASGSC